MFSSQYAQEEAVGVAERVAEEVLGDWLEDEVPEERLAEEALED